MITEKDKKLIYTFFGLKEGACGWWYHPDNPAMPVCPDLSKISTYLDYAFPKLYEDKEFRLLSYQFVGSLRDIDLLRHSVGIRFNKNITYSGVGRNITEAFEQALLSLIKGKEIKTE